MKPVKKAFLKKACAVKRMSLEEKSIIRRMHFDQHTPPVRVSEIMGRSLSAITRLLAQKKAPNRIGRPNALTEAKVDSIVNTLEKMVDEADAEHEVSMHLLMRRCRAKVCSKVVANALHKRGYRFHDLRHKPILTPDDVKDRYAWSIRYRGQIKAWWIRKVHMHWDNHAFKQASTGKGRKLLAKRRVRGVYRKKGKSLRSGHVKPNPKLRLSLGTKAVMKSGGVGGGKVLVWHTINGAWCGDKAAEVYTDVVKPALQKHYPTVKRFCVLEDNDPTGNLSKKGIRAKEAAKISQFTIPKRSPDLNVLDYSIWAEVERRLRIQEKAWPLAKRESRAQFERRLDQTALRLPATYINDAIGNLEKRCELLYQAKGGLFEEGGRKRRPL